MEVKCNNIYSLFDRNIVLSEDTCINAITPYHIKTAFTVMGFDDVITYFSNNYTSIYTINNGILNSFTNPATNEWWYVGKYFMAYCNKKSMNFPGLSVPEIIMVYGGKVAIVDEKHLDDYLKFKGLIYKYCKNDSKVNIILTSHIGYLSYPSKAIVNHAVDTSEVKLPIVLS
nr:MAG TPA: hypothetical protein [Caudoviricetes sp.]